MTSDEPGSGPNAGDPGEDATQADWQIGAPQGLPPAQSLPPSAMPPAGPPPAGQPPAGPPPGPSGTPAAPPSSPPPPGYAPAPGTAPAPGYAPGYAPATAPGMAWAPPPEVVAGPGVGGLEYAGALPRFVAWIVDGLILGLIGLLFAAGALVLFAGSINWAEVARPGYSHIGVSNGGPLFAGLLLAAVIGALVELAYFVFFWTSGARATLGMRLLRLQVANAADGATLTTGQAVRRWIALGQWLGLLGYVPILGAFSGLIQLLWYLILLGTTVTSPTKQGAHDRFAGSVVVQPRGGSSNGLVVGCLLIIGLLVVLPIVAIVALIFLGSQVSNILVDVGNSV